MTNCERFALASLVERVRPPVSLEVGTYLGGSLQVLAKYSQRVISVDIDPAVGNRLLGKFNNVEFKTGDSKTCLEQVVAELNDSSEAVGFVLIDGDHSREGVCRDINTILKIVPRQRCLIILHDSFNPECREGMRMAAWSECPYVHYVELDFIPGVYHFEAFDTASARSMWGGFACAVLEPTERQSELAILESQRGMFNAVYRDSCHSAPPTVVDTTGRDFGSIQTVSSFWTGFRRRAGKLRRKIFGT